MKKILVTGATGFIGNNVVKELLAKNYAVIASSSNEEKAKQASWFSQVKYIPFDLAQIDADLDYFFHFNEPDAMIHLAWEGLPNYKSAFHLEENLPRHSRFLSNMVHHGLKDLTVTGTCFEYGMQEGCLSEDMPAMPANAYAKAKDTLRMNLEDGVQNTGAILKWVRLFYMFGKGQMANSLFSQLDTALANGEKQFNMSGGEQVRDYLPVEKVAEYIVQVALQNKVSGIINCCSGVPVTVKQMVENYLKEKGRDIKLNLGYYLYPDFEPMSFWGDNTKLKSIRTND